MATFISKETINRLLKDIKDIIKNPLVQQGIYYIHDDTDMLKGYAMIIGPEDTPYFGGYYFFKIIYPENYPHAPPNVKYYTNSNKVRFNPNLYTSGKVCVSLLNTWQGDQWTSCQTISTVLLALCTLLCENPLLNEPGISLLSDSNSIKNYNEIIQYSNINIAICDVVNKSNNVYNIFFDLFYNEVKETFNKNYDKLLTFTENKFNEHPEIMSISVSLYDMDIIIDYNNLIQKLKMTKQNINEISVL